MRLSAALVVLPLISLPLYGQTSFPRDPDDYACGAGASPILVLGTFHMSNPGLDAVNLKADDPRSPKRQQEITDLLDRLARYKPTRIAIEATYGRSPWLAKYRDYVAGRYELGANEIEQIGFRLGKKLGLGELTAVDFPMWMDGRVPDEIDYDWKPPASEAQASSATPAEPNPEDELLRRSTVVEYLRHINSDEYTRTDNAFYVQMLRPDSTGNAPYRNTDLVTNWYKRNLRIFTNIYRTTNLGTDRVLLVIGSGHVPILSRLAIDSPDFCLVNTEAILK